MSVADHERSDDLSAGVPADLATRLDRLETRAALADLAALYCRYVDAKHLDALLALFTPDCAFEAGGVSSHGHDEVRAFFTERLAHYEFSFHVPHTQVISFDPADADRASAVLTAHAEHGIGKTCVIAALEYRDSYQRLDGSWRFARRTLTSSYFLPVDKFVGSYERGANFGRPVPYDSQVLPG